MTKDAEDQAPDFRDVVADTLTEAAARRDIIDVARDPSHNAREAAADDRHMLNSLRKIDDVDARQWRMQQRIEAAETELQQQADRITALEAPPKGKPMVKFFLWSVVGLFVLGLAALALWGSGVIG